MTTEELQKRAGRISALIYIPVSLSVAGAFFGVSSALGYSNVARFGGAIWVLLLSMIITMPTISPLVKKRLKG